MKENMENLILRDLNLSIQKGEFVAILGHNGSGKSTLAKHFNGLLQPVAGNVYVDDKNTMDEALLWEIRSKVGMVFQNPDNQIITTVVEEDVAFAPENLCVPSAEIRKRVDEALKLVDMYRFRKHAPHMLSGGQKQRIAIAGAIAMRPDYIVLDEPTAMLDPKGRREVMDTIVKLNREEHITIILVTHHMDEAAQAKRVVVMNKGKIVMDDTPRNVFSHVKEMKEFGLDVPQVTELAYSLKKMGYPINHTVLSVSECVDEIMHCLEALDEHSN